ncbi:MAG: glucose-1-phosphate adenylyltransferase [Hyphomicrobiales bacterium]|nr:MAG: glucose-1-phosphate adenylyltransferase [Hyphomicrobiales bacterium]
MNASPTDARYLAGQTMALVLAGGRGSRLYELTDRRAKPAVPFAGKSRIIDFALSNAYNSGFRRIGVATQYKSHSLIRHLQQGWSFFRPERNESLDILPASQRIAEDKWYVGTADAVTQNMDIIKGYDPKYIIILAGDHIYKMDYAIMLSRHVESGADVTVGCIEVPRSEASAFGVMHVDENDRIVDFVEKPADPPPMPDKPDMSLSSMGIYVFETAFLFDLLMRDMADETSSHDFGHDLIPALVRNHFAMAHRFNDSCVRSEQEEEPYWRDVGTIDALWETNINLTDFVPALDIYDRNWPIWTFGEITPPAKFIHNEEGRRGSATSSLISGGCIVSGSYIHRSLLYTGVHVHSFSQLEGVVVLNGATINRGSKLKNAIIDSGVEIPAGLVVGEDPEEDARRFRRSAKGIVLITQKMIDALG